MDEYMFVSYTHEPRIYRAVKDGPVDGGRDDVTLLLGTREEMSTLAVTPLNERYAEYAKQAGFPLDQYGYRVLTSACTFHTFDDYDRQPHIGDAERALTPGLFGPKGLI